jgi:membrane associated rhomboid family serine protease
MPQLHPQERKTFLRAVADSLIPPFLFIVLLWVLKGLEWAGMVNLISLGVYPRRIDGLKGILTAPLVHGDFGHLFANSTPLFVLMAGILFFHRNKAWLIFLLITFGSGLFVWVFGHASYHIGASGLVYGCASFLVVSGFINRNRAQISISLLVFLFYGSMIWGILPIEKGVSWEAHLGGLLAGIGCAFLFRQPHIPELHDENDTADKPEIGEYFTLPDDERENQ